MPASYAIEVTGRSDRTVTLRVCIINPEEPEIYRARTFALMLLGDVFVGQAGELPPLAQAFPEERRLDVPWIIAHADDFIESVTLDGWRNFPPPRGVRSSELPRESLPQATMTITVTDLRWLSHLRDGDRWESSAFDLRV